MSVFTSGNIKQEIYRHSFKYSTRPSVRKVWEASTLYTHHECYILNTPKRVFFIGAFSAALRLSPRTIRVSAGSMIPSSHSLQTRNKAHRITPQTSFIRFLENFFSGQLSSCAFSQKLLSSFWTSLFFFHSSKGFKKIPLKKNISRAPTVFFTLIFYRSQSVRKANKMLYIFTSLLHVTSYRLFTIVSRSLSVCKTLGALILII